MPKQKTDTEIFVETCAGVFRAIAQLDQVARPHGGDDLQREAWKATGALQKVLDTAIRSWNEEPEALRVSLCESVGTFYWTDKCEIYTARGCEPGGYCTECLLAKGRA